MSLTLLSIITNLTKEETFMYVLPIKETKTIASPILHPPKKKKGHISVGRTRNLYKGIPKKF